MTDDASAALRIFLIADVRGYTHYTHQRGDEEAARLAARFAEIVREGIEAHGGQLVELRGDEALGVFNSAREALRAAVDLQRLVREQPDDQRDAFPLGIGIGLDAGEAVPVEGGYRGGALNTAARLCGLAGPGEVLATETVTALARRVEGIRFDERGFERLKGLERPVKVIEVVTEASLVARSAWLRRLRRRHVTRRRARAAVAAAVTAGTAAAAIVLLGGTDRFFGDDGGTGVGIVLSQDPDMNALTGHFRDGLVRAARALELETETFVVNDVTPDRAGLERVEARLRDGSLDLVVWAGYGASAEALLDDVRESTGTHVVYVDADLTSSPLEGTPNVTAIRFDTRPAARVAGYLGGLMARAQGGVSIVAGIGIPPVQELVRGYSEGARDARPRVAIRLDYSENFLDQIVCEQIANDQIDAGSSVVFTAAGECGTGAIAAAGIRGAWAVGVDSDRSHLGPHVLASVVKHFDRAVELAVRRFFDGTLPAGKTIELGLEDEAVGIVGISPQVPEEVRRKVAREAARIRADETRRP